MNILDSTAHRDCTSCQVCASICNRHAITIEEDEEGFYRPKVNLDNCTSCGLCTTVCYKFDDSIRVTSNNALSQKLLYSAWAEDESILAKTTSGGLADILARELMDQGYHVVGVIYNNEKDIAEHTIAKCESDLEKFRGSKYIQSYSFEAFQEIVLNSQNEKYAVFGTPCQIYAIHRWAEKRKMRDNFILIDLFCHGCPSMTIWKKYLRWIKSINDQRIIDGVSFRSKVRGWGQFYISFYSGDKIVYSSSPKANAFYELFFSDVLLNKACYDCVLRSTLEYTDIRLGDFWGRKYLKNIKGVSGVSIATEKGNKLFNSIRARIVFQRCDYSDFLPYQSWGTIYHYEPEKRRTLMIVLNKDDSTILDVLREYRKLQSLKEHCIRIVKILLSYFPHCVSVFIKSVFR